MKYETLDMEPIKEKKCWSIVLIIMTLLSFSYVMFLVSDNIFIIISQFLLVITALIGCIVKRKKKKTGILIFINSFSLLLQVLITVSVYINHMNMLEHMEHLH